MRYFFALLLLFAIQVAAFAQLKKGFKLLEKKKYDQAVLIFDASASNKIEAPCADYALSQIYFTKTYESYNLDLAFYHIEKAIAEASKADPKANELLQQHGMGLTKMTRTREDIVLAAIDKASKENTSIAFNHFLKTYKNITPNHFQKATQNRNQRAYDEALQAKTSRALGDFLKLYRGSCDTFNTELSIIAQKNHFETYIRESNWKDYPVFAYQNPTNIYVLDSAAAVKMQVAARKNTLADYKEFLMGYPKSPFAKIAVDSVFSHTLQAQKVEEYDYFVRNYPNYPNINTLWKEFYKAFCEENKDCSNSFPKSYPSAPKMN